MIIHFDYNIGDKVRLTKEVNIYNRMWFDNRVEFESTKDYVYTIKKYEVVFKEGTEPNVYYSLELENEFNKDIQKEYLSVHNELTTDYIEGVEEVHPFDEEITFTSHDNKIISLGDYVYDGLYRIYYHNNTIEPDINFTFSGYGQVVELEYSIKKGYSKPIKTIFYKRTFLCKDQDGKKFTDANTYGNILYGTEDFICYGVDDNYVKDYAALYVTKEKHLSNFNKYVIKEYLTHLGVYDKVFELVEELKSKKTKKKSKATPKTKTSEERNFSDSDLKSKLSQMTKEDKEALLKMLNNT